MTTIDIIQSIPFGFHLILLPLSRTLLNQSDPFIISHQLNYVTHVTHECLITTQVSWRPCGADDSLLLSEITFCFPQMEDHS